MSATLVVVGFVCIAAFYYFAISRRANAVVALAAIVLGAALIVAGMAVSTAQDADSCAKRGGVLIEGSTCVQKGVVIPHE